MMNGERGTRSKASSPDHLFHIGAEWVWESGFGRGEEINIVCYILKCVQF